MFLQHEIRVAWCGVALGLFVALASVYGLFQSHANDLRVDVLESDLRELAAPVTSGSDACMQRNAQCVASMAEITTGIWRSRVAQDSRFFWVGVKTGLPFAALFGYLVFRLRRQARGAL